MGRKKKSTRRNSPAQQIRKIENGVKAAVPIVALVAPAIGTILNHPGDYETMVVEGVWNYTGINIRDRSFNPERLLIGWGGYGASKVLKKALRWLGA